VRCITERGRFIAERGRCYFFLLFTAGLAVLGLAAADGLASALGMSPKVVLTGHTLKTGHFLQPTAMAIGHKTIWVTPQFL
jgi:hypothetical protein